jgi:hypothetical protein
MENDPFYSQSGGSISMANKSPHSVRPLTKLVPEARPPAQGLTPAFRFRGCGTPAAKSDALLEVSVHPLFFLKIAFALLGAAVGPTPRKQFAELP